MYRDPSCLLPLLATLAACSELGDIDRTGGNSERGYFAAELVPFPVGGRLELTIGDFEFLQDPASTEVRDLSASDPTVLRVVEVGGGGRVVLEGLAPGRVSLRFRGEADGEAIDDAFTLDVAAAARVDWGACGSESGVVRGRSAALPFFLADDGGNRLGGYGLYPMRVEPASAGTLVTSPFPPEGYVNLMVAPDAPAQLALQSTLPDGSELTLRTVDSSEVSGVGFVAPFAPIEQTRHTVALVGTAGMTQVCAGGPWRLRVRDSDRCRLVVDGEDRDEASGAFVLVELRLGSPGVCAIDVELVGVRSDTVTFEVEERPSSGGDADFD